jgi:hypothetical protein
MAEERVLVIDVGSTSFGTVKYSDKDVERIMRQDLPITFHTDDACEMSLHPEKIVDKATGQRREVMVWGFMAICLSRDTDAVHTSGKRINYYYYLDPLKGDAAFAKGVMAKGRQAIQEVRASVMAADLKAKAGIVAPPKPGSIVGPDGRPT